METPELEIYWNNCATNDPCAICGTRCDPNGGLDIFLKGTFELVCCDCSERYAPELVEALKTPTIEMVRASLIGSEPTDEDVRRLFEAYYGPRDDEDIEF